MSPAKLHLRFTIGAQKNLRHLLAHTDKHWGSDQSAEYEDEIFAALDLMREHPAIEVAHPDLTPGCRTHPVKRYVIYYRVINDTLEVLRILHERQSTAGQFDDLE